MKAIVTAMLVAGLLHTADSKAMYGLFLGDARSHGMANARVMLCNSWSVIDNPAGLADISTITLGLYSENNFQLQELCLGAFAGCIPTKSGTFGFGYITFGHSLFQQKQASVAYGKTFGNKFKAGIGLHYLMIRQPSEHGNLFALIPSFGIQVIPADKLIIGVHLVNPAHQQFIPAGSLNIPVSLQAGLGYSLGREILLCAEFQKLSEQKARIYGGFEIALRKVILVRFGISSGEFQQFSLGIGYQNPRLTIDFAATQHPVLGFSPAIGLTYGIK